MQLLSIDFTGVVLLLVLSVSVLLYVPYLIYMVMKMAVMGFYHGRRHGVKSGE